MPAARNGWRTIAVVMMGVVLSVAGAWVGLAYKVADKADRAEVHAQVHGLQEKIETLQIDMAEVKAMVKFLVDKESE